MPEKKPEPKVERAKPWPMTEVTVKLPISPGLSDLLEKRYKTKAEAVGRLAGDAEIVGDRAANLVARLKHEIADMQVDSLSDIPDAVLKTALERRKNAKT